MKLSILEQSPIRTGGTAQDALRESIQLAQFAEARGFTRFWVSEHHNTNSLAGSAPEVLIAALGAATSTIRLGSGGVMLPHYSAFKVAETFSMLSTLYPHRIDLGIGRAPGSDMDTARVLATDGRPKFERFPALVRELTEMLHNPDFRPKVTPRPPAPPTMWMLGSSQESAMMAAQYGLPYNFALFINNKMVPVLFDFYRNNFAPSEHLAKPQTILTVNVIVADTEAEAKRLAMSRALSFLRFVTGQKNKGIPTAEEAANYPYNAQEQAFIQDRSRNAVYGAPEQVKERLTKMAAEWGADEIMTVSITHDFQDRLRSYELLAEVFDLQPQPSMLEVA